MAKKMAPAVLSDSQAEFKRLFWDARRDHVRLKARATNNDSSHKAALAFANTQGWRWAEILLEASRMGAAGESAKALEVLERAEALFPEKWLGFFRFVQGASLGAGKNYSEAIKAYDKALADPNFSPPGNAWNNLGRAYAAKGEQDAAIEAFRKAIADPKYETPGNAWSNLGNVYFAKGERDAAIEAFRKAIADPKYEHPGIAWNILGNAYLEAGKPREAEKAFKRALAIPDPEDGQHGHARLGLQRLSAKIAADALSPDDRAISAISLSSDDANEIENAIVTAVQEAGDTQYDKYLAKPNSKRDNTLSILRGWSSAVTLLEGSERRWRGGGYFFKWNGFGMVIDPGFDFLRNFHDAGYHGREISVVVVGHNHPDHNSDLKDIDDLRYELYKRLAGSKEPGGQPYVLLWDQDTDKTTKFSIPKPKHQYEPVVLSCGYPQPINLLQHTAKAPVRVTPFKVNHGDDVPHAMGMVIELLDNKGEAQVRIGYTSDTAYDADLHSHLLHCDVLIAHISQPSIEELKDASKLKEVHLGYRGTARLLKECKPKLALIGEFWAGFTDLRIPLIKGLRQRSGVRAVLPAGLGMHLHLPSLDIECTECAKPTPFSQVKVAPPTDNFGSLAYLCPKCIIA